MRVKFWGVRGSIPTPLTKEELLSKLYTALESFINSEYYTSKNIKEFIKNSPFYLQKTYGGNTACIEIELDNDIIILDAGSGIRALGMDLMQRNSSKNIHLLISHTHWDHIIGFPFFTPAFIKGKKIRIYSPLPDIKDRLAYQQNFNFFPVALEQMAADLEYIKINENDPFSVDGTIEINTFKLNHPGDSYAYSVKQNNKKIVYATDNEIYGTEKQFIEDYKTFISDSDIYIFDAQYTLRETFNKVTWGHSSSTMGVELALETRCKNLVLFHFEPSHDDATIYNNLMITQKYFQTIKSAFDIKDDSAFKIFCAYEGLMFDL